MYIHIKFPPFNNCLTVPRNYFLFKAYLENRIKVILKPPIYRVFMFDPYL